MKGFLNDEQVAVLKQAHRGLREKRLADRIKAVLYLNYGLGYRQTARLLMFDETTLRRYIQKFQEKGIDGLLEMRYVGGSSRLTSNQETSLKRYFKQHTALTALAVANHLAKRYGVKYSVVGVTKLLHRLGFVYKKPKIVPGRADRLRQQQFLETYKQTKKDLKPSDQIYFVDSTHPSHNTMLSYGWILKGKKNDKYIKTNTGRDRLNLNGAINIVSQTAIVLEEKTVNSEATINLLENIRRKQKHGKVYLILDNASHHHARAVGYWLLHHPRFKLIFLPPYSPNLNPIERLWRFFHQRVTANHYFETFEEFKDTSLNFFKNLKVYKKELSTLLTDSFQLVTEPNFQT